MNSGSLAGLFRWLRQVVEEADKPFSLLITVILPVVAPIIPSIITSGNLQKYMGYDKGTATIAAIAFALVGYVAMVTAIGAIMNFVEQEKNSRVWLPVLITTGSYAVYVFALVMVNIVLEYNNGVSGDKISVTALMTLGLEIPAAMLNGTRINVRDRGEKEEKRHQEKRSDQLVKYKIKHGINPDAVYQASSDAVEEKRKKKASDYKDRIWSALDEEYSKGRVLRVVELCERFKLPYDKAKGFVSTQRTEWMKSRGVRREN